jgi:hypothetical protein
MLIASPITWKCYRPGLGRPGRRTLHLGKWGQRQLRGRTVAVLVALPPAKATLGARLH